MIANTTAARIRDARKVTGMTASELARRCGVSAVSVHNWEVKGSSPKPEIRNKLASALRVSEHFLMTGSEESHPLNDVRDTAASLKRRVAKAFAIPQSRIKIRIEFTY